MLTALSIFENIFLPQPPQLPQLPQLQLRKKAEQHWLLKPFSIKLFSKLKNLVA
jgi:hypothetical protein